MRRNKSVIAVLLISLFICVNFFSFSVYAESKPSIAIELDKTQAKVGDIIKASIKINNIENFGGFQIDLRYNPEVLEAVDSKSGEKYTQSTIPENGDLLLNQAYAPLPMVDNLPSAGVLNFGKSYMNISAYKGSGKPENTGTLAVIGFKVIKDAATEIIFEDLGTMPESKSGTLLFNWDGAQIKSDYTITQSPKINPSSEAAPMPKYTMKVTKSEASKAGGSTLIIVVLICVVLLIILALVFILRNNKEHSDENYEGQDDEEENDGNDESDVSKTEEPAEDAQESEEDKD